MYVQEPMQERIEGAAFSSCAQASISTPSLKDIYSGTSLKGLSELRTQYKKLPYIIIKDKFCSPNGTMLIHFYL